MYNTVDLNLQCVHCGLTAQVVELNNPKCEGDSLHMQTLQKMQCVRSGTPICQTKTTKTIHISPMKDKLLRGEHIYIYIYVRLVL